MFFYNLNEKGSILKLQPFKIEYLEVFIGKDIKSYIYPVIKNSIVLGC